MVGNLRGQALSGNEGKDPIGKDSSLTNANGICPLNLHSPDTMRPHRGLRQFRDETLLRVNALWGGVSGIPSTLWSNALNGDIPSYELVDCHPYP